MSAITVGRLEGARALVTGAASGIGRATAEAFDREGARLLLVDVQAERLREAADRLSRRVHLLEADVGDPEQVRVIVHEAERVLGAIDVLINNAGISDKKPFLDVEEEDWDRLMRVNLDGAFLVAQQVARRMAARRSGCIVHVSSISGRGGGPTQSVYGITKGGLLGLTRQMAAELGPLGIRVNAVLPGVIDTPMVKRSLERQGDVDGSGLAAWIREAVPLARIGQPEEVADVLLFLASADSGTISGCLFPVEGGFLAL